MLTIKMKNDHDLKVRVMLECTMQFGIKDVKYLEICEGTYKTRRVDQLRSRAFNHYQSLCDELKNIIREKRFSVEFDKESGIGVSRIFISDEFKDHFDNGMYESLSLEKGLKEFNVKDTEDLLSWHISRLEDILDVLMD